MKKLLSVLFAAALLSAAVPVGAAPVIYERQEVETYIGDSAEPVAFECLFRSDLPQVPWIDAETYLGCTHDSGISTRDNGDGTYTVFNGDCEMEVDAERDVVRFERYEEFAMMGSVSFDEAAKAPFMGDGETRFEDGVNGVTLDLGAYGIDAVGADGRVWLPYCTLNDMFADTYCAAVYSNGRLRFAATMSVMSDITVECSEVRGRAMADCIYNELCFVMDNFYGKPSSAILSEAVREKGFDRALAETNDTTARTRELLRSDSTADFCAGMLLLDHYFYDGGHTSFAFGQQFKTAELGSTDTESLYERAFAGGKYTDAEEIRSERQKLMEEKELGDRLTAQRAVEYAPYTTPGSWEGATLYQAGKESMIFSFDRYELSVVSAFREALAIADEKGARNFIIDVSCNGGGLESVSAYILAVICGRSVLREKIEVTGNVLEISEEIDKNLDGAFDAKDDDFRYDFRYAVLISRFSFSGANLMSCAAQDNGVAVLGETGGGGCCNITPRILPDGSVCQTSGMFKLIHHDGRDYDAGAVPDTALPGADARYVGFYDIGRMEEGVERFYSERAEASTAAETTAQPVTEELTEGTEAPAVGNTVSAGSILLGLGGSAALIAALLVILLIKSR